MKKIVLAGFAAVVWAIILVYTCQRIDLPKYQLFNDLVRAATTERQLGASILAYLAMVSAILMVLLGRYQVVFWELALFVLAPIALYFAALFGECPYFYRLLFFIAAGTLWRIFYRACSPSNN